MFKKVANYEVKLNENGFITGVLFDGNLSGVYKWDKKLNCYINVLPLTVSAFKNGIYSGRYLVK